jgi:integrase
VISDATMSRMMERRGMKERPHGFRASLRTWLSDTTDAPHEVAEMVLAHTADSKVVRTYRRTDFFEQRARLMERWSDHVTGRSGKTFKLVAAL